MLEQIAFVGKPADGMFMPIAYPAYMPCAARRVRWTGAILRALRRRSGSGGSGSALLQRLCGVKYDRTRRQHGSLQLRQRFARLQP